MASAGVQGRPEAASGAPPSLTGETRPVPPALCAGDVLVRHTGAPCLEERVCWVEDKAPDMVAVAQRLAESSRTNHFTNSGPAVGALERCLASLFKDGSGPAPHVAVMASGTAALHALVSALNMRADEAGRRAPRFATQAFTFPSSNLGPLAGSLVLDNDPLAGGPMLAELDARKDEVDAVIVTNVFGCPVDVVLYRQWCDANGKLLIMDNAAAPLTRIIAKPTADERPATCDCVMDTGGSPVWCVSATRLAAALARESAVDPECADRGGAAASGAAAARVSTAQVRQALGAVPATHPCASCVELFGPDQVEAAALCEACALADRHCTRCTDLSVRNLHSFADAAIVSLHHTKLFGFGEGGAVITYSPELDALVRRAANFGFEYGTPVRKHHGGASNYRMGDPAAAFLHAHLTTWVEPRVGRIDRLLRSAYELVREIVPGGLAPLKPMFPERASFRTVTLTGNCIIVRTARPVDLEAFCAATGIEAKRYYEPLVDRDAAPVAHDMFEHTVCLPIHSTMPLGHVKLMLLALSRMVRRGETWVDPPPSAVVSGAARLGPDFEASAERYYVLLAELAMCPDQVMTEAGVARHDVRTYAGTVPDAQWVHIAVARQSGLSPDAETTLHAAWETAGPGSGRAHQDGAIALFRCAPDHPVLKGAHAGRSWRVSGPLVPDTLYEAGCMNA